MTFLGHVARFIELLQRQSPEAQQTAKRMIDAAFPTLPKTPAERMRALRQRHKERDANVTVSVTEALPDSLRPRNANRDASVTTASLVVSGSFLSSSETTAVTESTNYPEKLQEIPEYLRSINAPGCFDNVDYWLRVDAWLGGNSGVFYLDELPKYLAWHMTQNGRKQHRNLLHGFRNWLAKSEYRSEQHAQSEAIRKEYQRTGRR